MFYLRLIIVKIQFSKGKSGDKILSCIKLKQKTRRSGVHYLLYKNFISDNLV
ncbi:hypothetical protein TDB9533_02905 [Thalassocella blandensis]|nr:hypothetical protein TDB9533_02905 [Thalassocella blandensis]